MILNIYIPDAAAAWAATAAEESVTDGIGLDILVVEGSLVDVDEAMLIGVSVLGMLQAGILFSSLSSFLLKI